jgi:hypothetical protein
MHGSLRSQELCDIVFAGVVKQFFPFLIKMCGDKHESLAIAMYRNFSHLPLTKEISIKFQIFARCSMGFLFTLIIMLKKQFLGQQRFLFSLQ